MRGYVLQSETQTFHWEIFDHLPCSSDHTPCDFHVFGQGKKLLMGQQFACNGDVKTTAEQSLLQGHHKFSAALGQMFKLVGIRCFNEVQGFDFLVLIHFSSTSSQSLSHSKSVVNRAVFSLLNLRKRTIPVRQTILIRYRLQLQYLIRTSPSRHT
ncbi:hypothetical protein TNCT_122011 [Trichonephila clavata]|uniref:Uncharacterized protein n=1 Tax=Trichonephila clavata TaxID=2740835 RepID=A0A8X6HW90_TRICU|nr:hypothetical protein TNCT_122011 [Trichonephila clavata]